MATIIHRLRDDALGLMGLEDIAHAPAALSARIISDANRAIQQISTFLDDTFHYEEQRGVYVQPKVVTTVDATLGSATIANLSGSASWMLGCTCQIAGSTVFNRLRKTSAGTFELARPFLGTTGTGLSVTIWHDSVQLPTDVLRIKAPFTYSDKRLDITDARTLRELFSGDQRIQGVPDLFAEISNHGGDQAPFLSLLLNLLPAGGAEIQYTAIGSIANFADFNDARVHVVPFDLEDSVLFPLFRFFLSDFPLFEGSKQELAAAAQAANAMLERLPRRSAAPRRLKRPKQ